MPHIITTHLVTAPLVTNYHARDTRAGRHDALSYPPRCTWLHLVTKPRPPTLDVTMPLVALSCHSAGYQVKATPLVTKSRPLSNSRQTSSRCARVISLGGLPTHTWSRQVQFIIPLARCPCRSSSKQHALCMEKGVLDLIKLPLCQQDHFGRNFQHCTGRIFNIVRGAQVELWLRGRTNHAFNHTP